MWIYNYVYPSELYHHGIKGQRWGIRRFQNRDGTLTEEGKRRFGTAENLRASLNKSGRKIKSRHRDRLEQKYMDKGYTKDQAIFAADRNIRIKRLVKGVVGVSLGAAAAGTAAVGYNYYKKHGTLVGMKSVDEFAKRFEAGIGTTTGLATVGLASTVGLGAAKIKRKRDLMPNGSPMKNKSVAEIYRQRRVAQLKRKYQY